MIGAVLGDIACSKWGTACTDIHFHPEAKLFQSDSFITDATVMASATKWAILSKISYADSYRLFHSFYPYDSYDSAFLSWINDVPVQLCPCIIAGSAARAVYIGEHFSCEERVIEEATKSAACISDHPEVILSAVTVALCTFYGKQGRSKAYLQDFVVQDAKYPLASSMSVLHQQVSHSFAAMPCQSPIPISLSCFFLSEDWESCIRNILSVNYSRAACGCIVGGIAEAFYGTTGMHAKLLLRRYVKDNRLFSLILK